ncbi:hypothetical protein DIS18_05145 [Algibacter marinivivus]|uniref:PKD domain-containing protein n=1 Tax=Algibacter marinivivus TaxID=2100723 RepID=A0A2U2X871_9FLAO|nr:hypothetical protein [Algibacter marinivivus]PWH83940.1 hypothetical protein DIS18_05145 [Algibacter marinivivus]
MKLFKKGLYMLSLLLLATTISCDNDDDNASPEISGLDFVIATLNLEGTEIGVVPTTVNSNNRIVYSVDFGATPDVDTDNLATSGPMVTYEYPNEDGTYFITVTASLQGAADVSITKEVTITEYVPPVVVTGPSNPLTGTWRVAQELGSLAVGPGLLDGSGAPWWSADDAALADRGCFWDDEFIFNDDGSFEMNLGADTWLEGWQGAAEDGCGTPVFPHDGSSNGTSTFTFNQAGESLTINGRGAYVGIPKAINDAELGAPSNAPDSVTYIAKLNGNTLELFIQSDVANNAFWYFKLVREAAATIVGTWRVPAELGSLAVGPGLLDGSGAPWWSADDAAVADRGCFWDDEFTFNEDGSFEMNLGADTWLEGWQGAAEDGCGAPVFPHDGSANGTATYTFNQAGESLTIDGRGAFVGIPKAINDAELASPADAPDSVTYIAKLNGDVLELFIQSDVANNAYWYFKLVKN